MHMLSTYQRNRLLLLAAAAASCAIFWLGGRWFGIPRYPGFEISLVRQPSPAVVLLLVGILLWAATAVSTAIAGTVRMDAGLFGAAVGLAALSWRGGPFRTIAQAATDLALFRGLALELFVLGAWLGVAWYALWLLHRRGRILGDADRDGLADQQHSAGDRLTALGAQVAATAVLVVLLARTDDKKQVLAAVGVASFLGTLLAYSAAPVRPSAWYWAGPFVVGVVGYVVASFGSVPVAAWKDGLGRGLLAPLARPLPLDYASFGPAGALLGYWMSRQWHRAKELEMAAQSSPA